MGADILGAGFGLEIVARRTLEMLMDGLNDELDAVAGEWVLEDQVLAERRQQDYEPTVLEHVGTDNFYLGHNPSLLDEKTPIDSYPNIAVMAYRSSPAGTDDGDQVTQFTDQMFVELMVRSSPQEGEETCDRRAWRTADAANRVVMSDPTLRGAAYGVSTPSCIVSEVFERPANPREGHGEDWFWQAARIEYAIDKFAPFGG